MKMISITDKWEFHDTEIIDYDVDYDNTLSFWIIIFCCNSFGDGLLMIKEWGWNDTFCTYMAFIVSLYIVSLWPHRCHGKYNLCYTSDKTDQYHGVSPGVSTQTEFPTTGAGPSPSPAKCLFF